MHIFRRPQSEKRCFLQTKSRHLNDCSLQWHICLVGLNMWISFTFYIYIYIHYTHNTHSKGHDGCSKNRDSMSPHYLQCKAGRFSIPNLHSTTNLPSSPAPRINFRSRSTVSASTWQKPFSWVLQKVTTQSHGLCNGTHMQQNRSQFGLLVHSIYFNPSISAPSLVNCLIQFSVIVRGFETKKPMADWHGDGSKLFPTVMQRCYEYLQIFMA